MCAARPAARSLFRCAAGLPTAPTASATTSRAIPAATCHLFHSSAQLQARRKPRFKNVRAVELGLVDDKSIDKFAQQHFPDYSAEEKEILSKRYSPEQIAALEAGEATIDPKDLTIQGRLRVDPYRMPYIDDLRNIQPIIDKRPRNKPPADPNARFMDRDEFADDLFKWLDEKMAKIDEIESKKLADFAPEEYKGVPENKWPSEVLEQAELDHSMYTEERSRSRAARMESNDDSWVNDLKISDTDVLEYLMERSSMTDGDKGSQSYTAPALPNKVPGVAGLYKPAIDPADEGLDDSGLYQDLKKQTGLTVREIMQISTKTLVSRFVHNQTRLGKIRKASVMVCAGNKNGWLGIGMAKSVEHAIAVEKARMLAIRNMRPVPRYENRTIYGNTEAKVGATVVQLFSRPPGFGLRVSHRIFEMCRAAGIWDLSARMPRRRTPMNCVKAAYEALMKQPDPEEIAMGRGKKLVDARKVYYGGAVY